MVDDPRAPLDDWFQGMRRQGQVAVLPHAGNPCWMCETTLRPHHHSLPSVAGRRGEPSVPRTDRHEVLHIMASDNARKPCAGTALRGHEMHTVPIRRDHEHGGPLGAILLTALATRISTARDDQGENVTGKYTKASSSSRPESFTRIVHGC